MHQRGERDMECNCPGCARVVEVRSFCQFLGQGRILSSFNSVGWSLVEGALMSSRCWWCVRWSVKDRTVVSVAACHGLVP